MMTPATSTAGAVPYRPVGMYWLRTNLARSAARCQLSALTGGMARVRRTPQHADRLLASLSGRSGSCVDGVMWRSTTGRVVERPARCTALPGVSGSGQGQTEISGPVVSDDHDPPKALPISMNVRNAPPRTRAKAGGRRLIRDAAGSQCQDHRRSTWLRGRASRQSEGVREQPWSEAPHP